MRPQGRKNNDITAVTEFLKVTPKLDVLLEAKEGE